MRFSNLVVKTLAVLAVSSSSSFFSGSNGLSFARAEESTSTDTPAEEVVAEAEAEPATYVPPANAEKYKYEAEVHKMLDIVVNSLYQNNDVFLRELISNASDALDKIRYLLLTEPETYNEGADLPLEVKIEYDDAAHTLTIRDTGVGMTHDEMVQNLGTVARSGTTKFIQALKDSGNNDDTMSQIGQFGVGFYSTFLVADRVTVASKNPTDPLQRIWESDNGASEFIVYDDPRGNTLGRGTEITLHLKEECLEYTKAFKIRELAKHYSEFVIHPISLRTTETVQVEIEEEDEDEFDEEKTEKNKEDDELEVGDDEEGDAATDEEKPKQTKEVTTYAWDVLNGNQAIWTREKEDISDDEYQAFWKVLSGDSSNATTWTHFNAEGSINFKSLLYLPDDIPDNYKYGNIDLVHGSMRLYVRKVLIGDSFELLPKYLSFIRGVVDSDDLPLNVNRETLQESKILKVIQKKVVRKGIDLIRQLAKESESKSEESEEDVEDAAEEKEDSKYIQWYKKFAPNLKLGVIEDHANQAKLVKLLRYQTSKSDGKLISLAEYTENMKEWQKDIYVLGCVNSEECSNSPFLEAFREKDAEVLFLTDAVDEYMIKQVRDFDGKKLVQISNDNVKLNDEDEDLVKRREKVYQAQYKPLTKWLRKIYHGTVLRVQVAKRSLGSVPAIVSSSDFGSSANMERILMAQAFQHGHDASSVKAMKVFEVNPRHPLIIKLLEGCPPEDAKDDDEVPFVVAPELVDAAWMLHDMAMLNGGFPISDSEGHNKRMAKVLQAQFGLESLALEPEITPPVEEDEPPEPAGGMGGMNMDDFEGMGGPGGMNMDDFDMEALMAQMGGEGINSDEL